MSEWLSKHRRKLWIAAAILAVVVALVWFFVGYYYDTWNVAVRSVTREFIVRDLFPSINPLHWTPLTYLFASLVLVAAVFGVNYKYELVNRNRWRLSWNKHKLHETSRRVKVAGVVLVVAAVLSTAYTFTGFWNNDKDGARSYADSTSFVVEDVNKLPASLNPLVKGGSRSADGAPCLFSTEHDVPSCVIQGKLPSNWDSRSASLTGADIVMSRTSGAVANTEIMKETLTYVNDSSSWTAIRNGVNKQPLNGIVSWDGSNSPQTCRFDGKYALNYAFGGQWGQNLSDTLAKDYPGLLYSGDDVWGYCKGDGEITKREPVIVIPVTEQQSYGRRTTLRSAGVLTIVGSPSGEPVISHRTSVKAGEFPGPVYPLTLVAQQREMIQWTAGRANKNRLNFGYEPSDVAAQNGNNSEYLLRDKDSGRLFWVTPLKPRSTDSQLLVAYSITPADEAGTGTLNEQKVYVLPDEDPRIVNVDDMEARVGEAIRNSNPGFFTGEKPGKISEFLPVTDTTWQAFAELNGRVVFRVVIPTDSKVTPTVQTLDSTGTTPPASQTSVCTKPQGELSDQELADCISQFAKELAGRK